MALNVTLLTDDPQYTLMVQQYWEIGDDGKFVYTVKHLAGAFGIAAHKVSRIAQEQARVTRDDVTCEDCGDPFPVTTRSTATTRRPQPWHCGDHWVCDSCIEARREAIIARKQAELQRGYDFALAQKTVLADLPAQRQIELLALLRHCADATQRFLQSLESVNGFLAPSPSASYDLLNTLWNEGLITPHVLSPPSATELYEDHRMGIYLTHVHWHLAAFISREHAALGRDGIDVPDLFQRLEDHVLGDAFLRDHAEEIERLAWEVLHEEALGYLAHLMEARNLEATRGEKTVAAIDRALSKYSMAQVYSILWSAVKSASDFAMRGNTRKHAANIVPGAINSFIDNAERGGWQVHRHDRIAEYPQSTLSKLIFHDLLNAQDGGFYIPLNTLLAMREAAS